MWSRAAMRFKVFSDRESHADGKDGDVLGRLDLLRDLVEIQLTEGVHSGRYQDDVLAALNTLDPIHGVIERIEKVRFAESRDAQLIQSSECGLLILGEIHH